jgi:hypothetical protein
MLTEEEKNKFAKWCKEQAHNSKFLISQMEKLGLLYDKETYEREAMAFELVARRLVGVNILGEPTTHEVR